MSESHLRESHSPNPAPRSGPRPTFTFFGGKGGVGKTTCAAATAVAHAQRGRRVVVISTDPAHSLGDAFGVALSHRLTAVPVKPSAGRRRRGILRAVHLDADRVLDRWLRDHSRLLVTIGERGTYLDRSDVERLMDLSFPGVSELLALAETVRIASTDRFDEAIVDTAPTGHTLRLLATPEALGRVALVLDDLEAKHRAVVGAIARRYSPDEVDRFIDALADQAASLRDLLRDIPRVTFVWVTIPEVLAVAETRNALAALRQAGISVDTLVLNRVSAAGGACESCRARISAQSASIQTIETDVGRGITIRRVPLLDAEPVGVEALARVGGILDGRAAPAVRFRTPQRGRLVQRHKRDPAVLRRLLRNPPRLIFIVGKGGVGKTTCAAALAVAIAKAHAARRVLLLSIDPAHSVGDVLEQEIGNRTTRVGFAAELFARELDAPAEFARARDAYGQAVDELFDRLSGGTAVDLTYDRRAARDLIELAPPGLDELLALTTITDLAAPASSDRMFHHVVIDTAPTGHAMRLFDMRAQAHEWVRALMAVILKYGAAARPGRLAAELVSFSRGLRQLDAVFQTPRAVAIVPVTRAARLPRHETIRLISSLSGRRLPPPRFVVVNAVSTGELVGCGGCRARTAAERAEIGRLRAAVRGCDIILAPATTPPPHGVRELWRWIDRWQQP